ncbi:UDP-N-acetylmuramate:L-alanyl-gamma-D-glutamyl-meso-diaminopimelate ligase, partial [Escherichia coli]|nr:UDP-N-acetylmuramate:L-alanyl-gamma-D-glutamyl-meso-diaminopimelate ligase [Escherichia coli]
VDEVAQQCSSPAYVSNNIDDLVEKICAAAKPGTHILVMSNGGFGGIHNKLLATLKKRAQ